jgi:hypothetical protein
MAAALAKIAIGGARDPRLLFGDGLDAGAKMERVRP